MLMRSLTHKNHLSLAGFLATWYKYLFCDAVFNVINDLSKPTVVISSYSYSIQI